MKNVLLFILGTLIYCFGTQYFIVPAEIAPGGAIGCALMVHRVFGLPIGLTTFLINVPLLILSWFFLSRRFTVRTAFAAAAVSIILDCLIAPICPMYAGDRLLGSSFGGIIVGVGMGLIFLSGCTTGGTDIAGYLLKKFFPQMSIGRALMMIESVILTASIFVFNDVNAGLFGLISVYVQTKAIDAVVYGNSAGSQATIITSQPEIISARIISELERTATILPGKGAYSGMDISILICAVPRSEFSRLRQIIAECDPTAFVMVTESSEVLGLGFRSLKENTPE